MSGLGKVPSFEPDEEAKALIEAMFTVKKEEVKEIPEDETAAFPTEVKGEEEKPASNAAPKRRRIKIPEPPEQTKEQQAKAIELAKQELDIIHDAFMEFSEQTSDTVIYGYLYGEILKLVESFQDMETMINDTIEKEKITENGMEWYEKMRKIRARILNDVYNRNQE
jgi:hypothetical protein